MNVSRPPKSLKCPLTLDTCKTLRTWAATERARQKNVGPSGEKCGFLKYLECGATSGRLA